MSKNISNSEAPNLVYKNQLPTNKIIPNVNTSNSYLFTENHLIFIIRVIVFYLNNLRYGVPLRIRDLNSGVRWCDFLENFKSKNLL